MSKDILEIAKEMLTNADTGTNDCKHYNNGFMDGVKYTIKALRQPLVSSSYSANNESSWSEEEKKKLNECGFYPYWGDESDYRREVSYGDAVDDYVYKWSSSSYSATIHEREWDDEDYYWNHNTQEFNNFESLIYFLTCY